MLEKVVPVSLRDEGCFACELGRFFQRHAEELVEVSGDLGFEVSHVSW